MTDKKLMSQIELTTDYPALCAQKLKNNEVDIGLVPIAVLPQLDYYQIITDFCIGTNGNVKSVMLFSDVKIHEISEILLDYQSLTSVNLTKILSKFYWKISPKWIIAKNGYEHNINGRKAGLIIGDRALNLINKHPFAYDLAEYWHKMTNLPFVFAVWTANKQLSQDFVNQLNTALKKGIDHIDKSLNFFKEKTSKINYDAKEYLTQNIDYKLDTQKRQAIDTYLNYLTKI